MPLTSGRTDSFTAIRGYRGFGLAIASEIAIPGAIACAAAAAAPDLAVRIAAIPEPSGILTDPPYRAARGWLELTVPRIGRFVLDQSRQLWLDPDPGANEEDLAALLVATGLPMTLWARGGLVLHAAAVAARAAGPCVVIAGPSGSGKSTLLHHLVGNGGFSVADDSLWLKAASDGIEGAGLPGGCFLGVLPRQQRRFQSFPEGRACGSARVGALIVLDPARSEPGLTRLTGVQAMQTLLRQRHRPRIPRLLGSEPEGLAQAALLCAKVPIYALKPDAQDLQRTIGCVQAIMNLPETATDRELK